MVSEQEACSIPVVCENRFDTIQNKIATDSARLEIIETMQASFEARLWTIGKLVYIILGGASVGGFFGGMLGSFLVTWLAK